MGLSEAHDAIKNAVQPGLLFQFSNGGFTDILSRISQALGSMRWFMIWTPTMCKLVCELMTWQQTYLQLYMYAYAIQGYIPRVLTCGHLPKLSRCSRASSFLNHQHLARQWMQNQRPNSHLMRGPMRQSRLGMLGQPFR